jgi:hypothetical protein
MAILGVVLMSLSLVLLGSWTPGNYAPKPDEELCGTWTNTTELGKPATRALQKEIHSPGKVQTLERLSDITANYQATEQIDTK